MKNWKVADKMDVAGRLESVGNIGFTGKTW